VPEVYARPFKVMFQHCDPAGIVFYPRYFEMINATVEDWFETEVGVSFAAMHGPRQFAIPAAHIAVDFLRPSRLGDVLDVRLSVERMGGASMALKLVAHGAEGPALTADLTIVHVLKDTMRPAPWPGDIRARVDELCEGAA
jgi:4-hydroxybenzoyl-CoA thioesterase